MPDAFLREAAERGLRASRDDLQALHRLGLPVPIFRVRRDGRAVASAARRHGVWGRQAGRSAPTSRADLLEAGDRGALFDPSREPFVGRRRWIREAYGVQYPASEYLYSHHQLLLVPLGRQSGYADVSITALAGLAAGSSTSPLAPGGWRQRCFRSWSSEPGSRTSSPCAAPDSGADTGWASDASRPSQCSPLAGAWGSGNGPAPGGVQEQGEARWPPATRPPRPA